MEYSFLFFFIRYIKIEVILYTIRILGGNLVDKRKIIVLLVLSIAVIGFTMGQACAATTTIKVGKYKDVGKGDRISTFYQPKDAQYLKGVYAVIFYHNKKLGDDFAPHTYVLSKIKVYYKNKKGKVITRTSTAKNISGFSILSTKKINGYTPYKMDVSYRKMTSSEKKKVTGSLFY